MVKNRSKMPKPEAIMAHWIVKFAEQGLHDIISTDANDIPVRACFACGCPRKVERAHINAVVDGGTHDLDNLHLLCSGCHIDSEMFSGESYDNWFRWRIEQEDWLLRELRMLAESGMLESHPLYQAFMDGQTDDL